MNFCSNQYPKLVWNNKHLLNFVIGYVLCCMYVLALVREEIKVNTVDKYQIFYLKS